MRRFESARGLLSALLAPALLLFWSGIAATAFTGLVAAPLLGTRLADLALAPRRPATGRALALGLAGYPLAYGLAFAAAGTASLATGTLFGTAHAALLALLSLRHGGRSLLRANGARLLLCVLYGAMLGFAFVTP